MEYIVKMKDIKKYEVLQQLIKKENKGYYGGLHVNISQEQENTQIERALKELDINLILETCLRQKEELKDYLALFRID